MNEQTRIIESLKAKCKQIQADKMQKKKYNLPNRGSGFKKLGLFLNDKILNIIFMYRIR